MPSPPSPRDAALRDRIRGCLLGLTVGDALGAPVRRRSLAEIREWYGPHGITNFAPAFVRIGAVTAHSQLALWTTEGMMRAAMRGDKKGMCNPASVIHHAYIRWLHTQGLLFHSTAYPPEKHDGWLIRETGLFEKRSPGSTTVEALQSGTYATPEEPPNRSKGSAAVPRTAAVGLLALAGFNQDIARESAAITHGHPTAAHAAGAVAVMVGELLYGGADLSLAVGQAKRALIKHPTHERGKEAAECLWSLFQATHPSGDADTRGQPPTPEAVESFGKGYTADQALGLAVYAALAHQEDFRAGVTLAVNHSGASSTTGAITGALLGAALGEQAIPIAWRQQVELAEVTLRLADDLADYVSGGRMEWDRYPGW